MIAKVMLTNAGYALSREFDYAVPQELEDSISLGVRVLVPFGVRNATSEAVVIGFSDIAQTGIKLKSISKIVGGESILNNEQIELCKWMQEKYLCSFSHIYKLVRPPKTGTKIRLWCVLERQPAEEERLTETQKKAIAFLNENDGVSDYVEMAEQIGAKGLKVRATSLPTLVLFHYLKIYVILPVLCL